MIPAAVCDLQRRAVGGWEGVGSEIGADQLEGAAIEGHEMPDRELGVSSQCGFRDQAVLVRTRFERVHSVAYLLAISQQQRRAEGADQDVVAVLVLVIPLLVQFGTCGIGVARRPGQPVEGEDQPFLPLHRSMGDGFRQGALPASNVS